MDGAARADLWRRTQGWCVGVRILLGQGGTAAMPLMHEYLQHELLARMGEAEREVLQGLAHLPKLSAELCAELWEEQGGGLIFQRLLQLQAFLAPVDRQGQWYRLLPLVAHALQGDLAPAELNRLRLRACRLLSMGGHMNEAIELALEASQPEVAASYMERLELEWLLNKDHLSLFIGWLDQMPAHLLQSTSRLLCLSARALLFCGRLDEAEECLQHLGRFVPLAQPARNARLLANWQALYGNLQGLRGNAELSRQHSRDALAGLPARDWLAAVLCHVTLARVAMASGELKEAGQSLQEAVELARRQGCLDAELLVNVERLRLMILQGQFSLAEALLQGDMARVAIGDDQPCPIVGRMLLLEGELHLLQGRLCESEASLQAALQRLRSCSGPHVMPAYVMLSEIAACRGDFDRACMYLHDGERRMHCGNIDDACYKSAIAQQTMRVLGRQGCWDQVLPMARALAERLHGATPRLPPLGMPSLPQRNQLLLSLAEYETGRYEQARLRLAALYEQCKRIRLGMLTAEVQRALVDMGGSAAEHEQDCATEGEAEAGCIAADTSPLSTRALRQGYCLDELTPREVSVLKLLAEGMSNQEIGNTLFISVNTVKYHAKNINAKLGASRRTQAIHWAKAKGILG
ncbi:HTH-type transcriptional regulator MalT [compost metagenome]